MADEIKARVSLQFSKDGIRDGAEGAGTFDLASSTYQRGRQIIGTSGESLLLGDVATGGWCFIENLDDTNFVLVGPTGASADADYPIQINAGEFSLFRLSTGALPPKLKADTAPVDVEYLVLSA